VKRTLYNELLSWKRAGRRKPLVLYGARQVGKTWLLREFGGNEYKSVVELNFDADRRAHQFFGDDLSPRAIIASLEGYYNVSIRPADTLLIFDEIQECQRAKDALKYFNDSAPEYHIAAAGSFLGIAEGKFPVGQVDALTLRPLSFYEFLAACGKDILLGHIASLNKEILRGVHGTLTDILRTYFYVGGMPEAVQTYLDNPNDMHAVRRRQEIILTDCKNDFTKHIKATDIPKVRMIWQSLPVHLSKERKKFIYKELKQGGRASEFENALDWLSQTGLVDRINRTAEGKIPLAAYQDRDVFKVFMHDVGLLSAMSGLDVKTFYTSDPAVFKEFKGALAEQFVLQELRTLGAMPIAYWGNDMGKSEVDFVIHHEGEIIPIEVKSDLNKKSYSLGVYIEKYHPSCAVRTSLNGLDCKDGLYSVPLYLIASLADVIRERIISL
jgi:predicted AAA+ superfamily ATPase